MRDMKDSGIEWIGEIPVDWSMKRVKHIFTRKNEKAMQENPTILSLARDGVKVRDISNNEGQIAESYYNYNPVEEGDLLLNPMDLYSGANCSISKVQGVISPAYINLKANAGVNPDFYDYYFKVQYWLMAFFSYGKGVSYDNRWTLSAETLMNYPVVSLSYDEQCKRADYLDRKCSQIDAIIARQQEVIEKLKAYKLSVITEAVTKGLNPNVPMKDSGVEWIGEIPKHWAIHKFCWDYSAMLGKMLDAKRITGERLRPYIKNADVQWDNINFENLDEMDFLDEEKERYTICPGDLMVCEGGEIGKCAIVPDNIPEGIYYQKALHRVRKRYPDSGNVYFLSKVIYCMAKNNCLNTSPEKATIAHLPGDALSQLRIPMPPVSEQDQIAQYLNEKCREIDRISARKQETIDKLIEYKKSLIYEVVTGKKEV
ncbi:restriction endonuclease subunit S [Gemmiger formicilis]|uniref:restriction endonuclease subunit S n=1 Tax=Gemmiger formicilis TaxID=745368 RepID=UPI001956E5B4|nr:restriction endonuclease subunit S [Gemmiger formicilis]MBM6915482.1 restriction endonuclease subunit S [Gemmiger formicilis]